MTTVVSIINLKGGVAKTTTTVQLAECLASEFSKKVLVIDLDPQTNATIALLGEKKWEELNKSKKTIYDLFQDKLEKTSYFKISEAIQHGVSNLKIPHLSLLASSISLVEIQDRIRDIPERINWTISPMEVLKSVIDWEFYNYDYIFIDCPPNLGLITQNGIEISDYFLIPVIPDILSTYGIPQIFKKIYNLKIERNLAISFLGLVMTKYLSNSNEHKRVKDRLPARLSTILKEQPELREGLKIPISPIFTTVIPQANSTAEAMDFLANPSTFKQKYGYTKAGNYFLYEYVLQLTKEFMEYVGNRA